MAETFQKKCGEIKNKFASLSADERYSLLMKMGKELPPLPDTEKNLEHLVKGCQSLLYLSVRRENGRIYFNASADALISAGLAALLIAVYSGETAETILKEPPHFLNELGIFASLSPSRSNGLSQIHLRMKQEALKALV